MSPEHPHGVSSWLKALVVMALVLPMTAYVVGSLASSGVGEPADRGPVILDNPTSPTSPPRPGPRDRPVEDGGAGAGDDHSARVVTPTPVPVPAPVDDDDDDPTYNRDKRHDDADDDTTDRDNDDDTGDDGSDDGSDD